MIAASRAFASASYWCGLTRDTCALCGAPALPRARGLTWTPETRCEPCLLQAIARAMPEVWYDPHGPLVTLAGTDLAVRPSATPLCIAICQIKAAAAEVAAPRLLLTADASDGDLQVRDAYQPRELVKRFGELWQPPELVVGFHALGPHVAFTAKLHTRLAPTLRRPVPSTGDLYGDAVLDDVATWLADHYLVRSAERMGRTSIRAVTHAGEDVSWVLAGCSVARRFAASHGDFATAPILRRQQPGGAR